MAIKINFKQIFHKGYQTVKQVTINLAHVLARFFKWTYKSGWLKFVLIALILGTLLFSNTTTPFSSNLLNTTTQNEHILEDVASQIVQGKTLDPIQLSPIITKYTVSTADNLYNIKLYSGAFNTLTMKMTPDFIIQTQKSSNFLGLAILVIIFLYYYFAKTITEIILKTISIITSLIYKKQNVKIEN